MKNALIITGGIIACILLQVFLPLWWAFAPFIFLFTVFFRPRSGWRSFGRGMFIIVVTWLVLFIYYSATGGGVIGEKMAAVFSIPGKYLFFIVISIVMGLIGGLASASAYFALRRKA